MNKLLAIFLSSLLIACSGADRELVLVSKDPSGSYSTWLLSLDSNLKIREFYSVPLDSMKFYLEMANGFLMTGGEDIDPSLYDKPDYKSLCEAPDPFRDSIEQLMIRRAMRFKKPLLGICRGQQIINATNGGTLIPDIPTHQPESKIPHRSKLDSAHTIIPSGQSWIAKKFGIRNFWVNSRHHQCVDDVAPGFIVAAVAPDGIIESIEGGERLQHPFVICVQWHPENLRDSLATELGTQFLNAMK